MSLDVFDEFILIRIFYYCVEDSSFSLILTCKEFKSLTYSTPKLLNQHCQNINQPLVLFKRNEDKHRYSYMWWLIQMNPKTLQVHKCVCILDVEILKELQNKFPCYFTIGSWSKLCCFALHHDKMNVFKFIWKKFGREICQMELNHVSQKVKFVEKYPVLITILSLAKFDLLEKLYKKFVELAKTLQVNIYDESMSHMYKTVDVSRIITLDKQIREEYKSKTSMRFTLSEYHWMSVISLNNKDVFLYNISQIKQKSNKFICSLCDQILVNGSTQLYFWVKQHWNKMDNWWSFPFLITILQDNFLFDLVDDRWHNISSDLFWHYFMEHSSESVLEIHYDKILSFAMLHPLTHYGKVIRSKKHLQLLFQMKTNISWFHVTFTNCETLLYFSKMNIIDNLDPFFQDNFNNEVLTNLRNNFNEELFALWLTKINHKTKEKILWLLNDYDMDRATEQRFINNVRLLDSYIQKCNLRKTIVYAIVTFIHSHFEIFDHYNTSIQLIPFFEVLKKHGKLLNAILFIELNDYFKNNHGLRLWMQINKDTIQN
jgi:hypothetical protein